MLSGVEIDKGSGLCEHPSVMTKYFWRNLPRPIVGLSPMDGFTDTAFRQICRSVAPDIVLFTEFTSAEGLAHDAERIKARFRFDSSEQPVIAQVFGSDISSFIHAAQWLEARGFAGIDINMGCPSRTVVKSECGIALRKRPDLAFRIVEAVATHTTLPVSVKTRLGWSDAHDLFAFGKGCESAGADLLTIHGRTYEEPYSAPADFAPIFALKEQLTIPVLGNGGIASRTDGIQKLGNLDGFLIGRSAVGNPWVFVDRLATSYAQKVPVVLRHAELLVASRGPVHGTREMRKHLIAYTRGLPNARVVRARCAAVASLEDIRTVLSAIEKTGAVTPRAAAHAVQQAAVC